MITASLRETAIYPNNFIIFNLKESYRLIV